MTAYLISTMPAAGHVAPFLPLASRLVADGHEVVWHTGTAYADRVRATGTRFAPFRHTPSSVSAPTRSAPAAASAGCSRTNASP